MDHHTKRKPGPVPSISRKAVVDVARRLREADGLTMTAISEELGVTIGALYRYVPDRDTLIGMLALEDRDHVASPSTELAWRQWLHDAIRTERRFWQDHPELFGATGLTAASEPSLQTLRSGVTVMTVTGLDGHDVLAVLNMASWVAYGLASMDNTRREASVSEIREGVIEAVAAAGVTELEIERIYDTMVDVFLDGVAARIGRSTPTDG